MAVKSLCDGNATVFDELQSELLNSAGDKMHELFVQPRATE